MSDTTAEADAVQRQVWAAISGADRVALAPAMSDSARAIALDGIRARCPAFDPSEVEAEHLHLLHGAQLGDDVGTAPMSAGSVASTHHGSPRSTQDIDVVVDPSPGATRPAQRLHSHRREYRLEGRSHRPQRPAVLGDAPVDVEDTMLAKLEWGVRAGPSVSAATSSPWRARRRAGRGRRGAPKRGSPVG
jgi:hypothetical protein